MQELVELQNIDSKLKDLNDLLGDLPSKIDELNIEEDELQRSLIIKKERQKEIEVENQKNEVQVSSIDVKINNLKDQLFLVSNNKQYDALMNEIDYLKKEKSSLETDILNILEEKDSLIESISSLENRLSTFRLLLSSPQVLPSNHLGAEIACCRFCPNQI